MRPHAFQPLKFGGYEGDECLYHEFNEGQPVGDGMPCCQDAKAPVHQFTVESEPIKPHPYVKPGYGKACAHKQFTKVYDPTSISQPVELCWKSEASPIHQTSEKGQE